MKPDLWVYRLRGNFYADSYIWKVETNNDWAGERAHLTIGALVQRYTVKWREESEVIGEDNLNQIQIHTRVL